MSSWRKPYIRPYKQQTVVREYPEESHSIQTRKETIDAIRIYCIYFPQFHSFQENDVQFYTGFTDIVNLDYFVKENPSYSHLTPSLKDLGLTNMLEYDLVKNKDLIQRQIHMLHDYNIDGFAIYYYWFSQNTISGKNMIMKDVIDRFFDDSLNMVGRKIYFIWANEDWTYNTSFGNNSNKIKNKYDEESNRKNIHNLLNYFKHANYLKIDNKPVLFIYHPWIMTQHEIDTFYKSIHTACIKEGFDGIYISLNSAQRPISGYSNFQTYSKSNRQTNNYTEIVENYVFRDRIQTVRFDYDTNVRMYKPFRNNRKKYTNVTEKSQEKLIQKTIGHYVNTSPRFGIDNILLINAWNEWGERMSVEPSEQKGYYYLEMIKRAFNTVSSVEVPECSINTNIDKTIIHVYTLKSNNTKGLGDFIRGSIFLAQYAKKNNITFKIDLSNHPISEYLEECNEPSLLEPVELNSDYNSTVVIKFLENFMKSSEKTTAIYTNVFYDEKLLTGEIREYINSVFKFKSKYYRMTEELTKHDIYKIIHIRCKDEMFTNEFKSDKLNIEILKLNLSGNIFVISNNYSIKRLLNALFGFKYTDTIACHTGSTCINPTDLEGSVIDYIMLTKSSYTYSFSFYDHGSGFSEQCSKLHMVPYNYKYLNNIAILSEENKQYNDIKLLLRYYENCIYRLSQPNDKLLVKE